MRSKLFTGVEPVRAVVQAAGAPDLNGRRWAINWNGPFRKSNSIGCYPATMLSALAYTANQWHKVICYTQDGRLSIDNNRAERAIKPFVNGRKNSLLSNTEKGASARAVIYSIIETAKANGINTDVYLKILLKELPKWQRVNRLTAWHLGLLKDRWGWPDAYTFSIQYCNNHLNYRKRSINHTLFTAAGFTKDTPSF